MNPDRFADIRPYNDDEVAGVIARLLRNNALLDAIARLRVPRTSALLGVWMRPLVRAALAWQSRNIRDVHGFQRIVERYMRSMVETCTTAFTVSGLERLDPAASYLFVGNHRDIALDPAFISYALFSSGRDTVRVAIGDNLLTRDYVSDLMRLNKSFIVRRSARGPRQMLAAYQELSGYISHSLLQERQSIWIAQREGRAKDGWDRTEPAIIKMLAISKPKEQAYGEFIAALHIVPVAISYEWDPCDAGKAHELCARAQHGLYQKSEHEDVDSIARSITAPKGAVHVAFGEPLGGDFAGPDDVAAAIDRQVLELYRLQPTNLCAYRMAEEGRLPGDHSGEAEAADGVLAAFRARLDALPEPERPFLTAMYANPIRNRAATR
jgi:1-acyl-sn-glycerol-3-phosphate acyltransferase